MPKDKPLKIVLINLHSSSNAGDAALTLVAIDQLKKNFPGSIVTLLMNDPASFDGDDPVLGSFMTFIRRVDAEGNPHWRWWVIPGALLTGFIIASIYRLTRFKLLWASPKRLRPVFRAYLDSDLVVSCPGGFLRDSGFVGLTNIITIFTMALGPWAGKPLYIFPQSIGPFIRTRELAMLRWILMKARIVMLREPLSMETLKAARVKHPRCYVLPDLGFSFQGAPQQEAKDYLASCGVDVERDRPLLGLTVINWGAQNRRFKGQSAYESAVVEMLRDHLNHHPGKVVIFPQVWGPNPTEDDRLIGRRIASQLPDLSHRIVILEDPIPAPLIKTAIGQMDVFVGTRMHSNIFALTGGVPVLGIAYQPKTLGIMRSLGLERWVVDIRTIDGPTLSSTLAQLVERLPDVHQQVEAGVPALVEGADQAGILVAADFYSLHGMKEA